MRHYRVELESIVRKRGGRQRSWGYEFQCEADGPQQAAAKALEVARSDLRRSETVVRCTALVSELESGGRADTGFFTVPLMGS